MTKPILIIEDDPDIAEVLRYSREKEKFETRVARNGEEGLSASLDRSNSPSIILLDLSLPGMNGIEICRRLRQEERPSNMCIRPLLFSDSGRDRSNQEIRVDIIHLGY